jgi:hypothetical protein
MREVSDVVLLVFSAVLVCVAFAGLGVSWGDRQTRRRSADHDPNLVITSRPGVVVLAPDRDSEREEMRLAGLIIAGDLTRDRYHQLMAVLAAEDARAHRLVVPWDRDAWPT